MEQTIDIMGGLGGPHDRQYEEAIHTERRQLQRERQELFNHIRHETNLRRESERRQELFERRLRAIAERHRQIRLQVTRLRSDGATVDIPYDPTANLFGFTRRDVEDTLTEDGDIPAGPRGIINFNNANAQ